MKTYLDNLNSIWWKWGDSKKTFHLNDFPKLKKFLEEKWNKTLTDSFKIPESRSSGTPSKYTLPDFQSNFPKLQTDQFSVNNEDRLRIAFGKGYRDAIKVFTLEELTIPDFVLFPKSTEDVMHILQQAESNNISVITFGGGSNVTGAFDISNKERTICSLNMKFMNNLLEIDEISHTATFQAGIHGPEIEEQLNEKGFTLGHFPQSFEFSTLGGWLATRSAGQESGLYGKI